ncbi:MAG: helix-turn-helix transcriptional regulator [Oscillospiraceae bacterium]|nr:helix-turn-helix transcriptional regulator [Oscillospiraceae bacterium]
MRFKIKELREARGLTQEELAAKSGISRATLWALESDETKVTTTKTLMCIADALSVPPEALFCGEDD